MENSDENKEKLKPMARLEIVKVLKYFANLSASQIAKQLGVDVSTISRDIKKIGKDFAVNTVHLDELSSILQFRAEKRQQELMKIYQDSRNPNVKLGALKNMREEDKCLIDILTAMTKLHEIPCGETINYISHIPQPMTLKDFRESKQKYDQSRVEEGKPLEIEVHKVITDKREDLPDY